MRRPRLDYESHATGLDRNEVGALLVAAGLAGASDHALISLLALNGLNEVGALLVAAGLAGASDHALISLVALNGLRVSEATGANIEPSAWSVVTAR